MRSTERGITIKARNVSVSFWVHQHGINSFKDFVMTMGFKKPFRKVPILQDISLDVYAGECLGLLGKNGSGKSTLLRTLAGIIKPEKGKVEVNGRIAPLLALGAGLELELSGFENIRILGALMGLTQKEIKEHTEYIIDFSGLGPEVLKQQVKRYSTGMTTRLAFSLAVARQPEILIIDEVLAVGDQGFQLKCLQRIDEIKRKGSTILFVSHSPADVQRICDRAVCLVDGKIIKEGAVTEVGEFYSSLFQ